MTDRELLEFAAKAVGLAGIDGVYPIPRDSSGNWYAWNPITDDADALRLAVKLDMNVFQSAKSAYALPSDDDGTYEVQVRYADENGDKNAATRRAIVRAAAEIGRQMK